ncbi:MAG: DNA translocase FtsK 4TM domain-containing protein, partial [candidate division NC10 bacterium]
MAKVLAKRGKAHPGRWQREVKGILALALAGFCVVALATFDPQLHRADQESLVGPVGIWLGWGFFRAFGYAGYLFPVVLAFYGAVAFLRPRIGTGYPVAVGLALLLVSATGLLARASVLESGIQKGGAMGWGVVELLRVSVGEIGTLFVFLTAIPIGLLFLTQASYAAFSRRVRADVANLFDWRRQKATTRPVREEPAPMLALPTLKTKPEPAPPPLVVVETAPRKAALVERGPAKQETFNFGKGDRPPFQLPPVGLLSVPPASESKRTREDLQANADILKRKLQDFGVEGHIVQVNPGPVITSYEFEPAPGIKVSQVVNLADDLALAMKVASVRIVGPIPGRGTVAVEVPNPEFATVYLRESDDVQRRFRATAR